MRSVVKIGYNGWLSRLVVKIGCQDCCQDWFQGLVVKIGCNNWMSRFVVTIGCQDWL